MGQLCGITMSASDRENSMEKTGEVILTALKAALKGEQAEIRQQLTEAEWKRVLDMAGTHRVLPLIFEAVYGLPDFQEKAGPLAAQVKKQVFLQVMTQTRKTNDFLALYHQLRNAGLRPLVVKGILCRELYPKPDCRASSDEDLLVRAEECFSCHNVLLSEGLEQLGEGDDYEIPYRGKDSPLYIELHNHLFPPESDAYGDLNRFFENVHDHAVAEEIQGQRIWTLEPTEHLFYLICHSFKHFLHSGFGLRQVCDIVLYANAHGHEIRWEQVLEKCRAIRADKFAAAMLKIGEEHLIFDPDQAALPESWRDIQVDPNPMLKDLLEGGIYGDSTMSRKHSSNITLAAVASEKQGRKSWRGSIRT